MSFISQTRPACAFSYCNKSAQYFTFDGDQERFFCADHAPLTAEHIENGSRPPVHIWSLPRAEAARVVSSSPFRVQRMDQDPGLDWEHVVTVQASQLSYQEDHRVIQLPDDIEDITLVFWPGGQAELAGKSENLPAIFVWRD